MHITAAEARKDGKNEYCYSLRHFTAFCCRNVGNGHNSAKKSKARRTSCWAADSLGGWFSAFAYGTTYFSAVVFIGYGGSVSWKYGLSSVWIGIGNALIGTLAAWLILGKSTYRAMERYHSATMPEFFKTATLPFTLQGRKPYYVYFSYSLLRKRIFRAGHTV